MASKLKNMLPSITDRDVTVSPFCWRFAYRFTPPTPGRQRYLSSCSSLTKAASVPDSLHLSSELSGASYKMQTSPKYQLNAAILQYLEKTSPLVAALVTLVSPLAPKLEGSSNAALEASQESEEAPTGLQQFFIFRRISPALKMNCRFIGCLRRIRAKHRYSTVFSLDAAQASLLVDQEVMLAAEETPMEMITTPHNSCG